MGLRPRARFARALSSAFRALTSASPYRVLNFQDGVTLLFLVLSHGSPLFDLSRCNRCSISSFLIFPLPADHKWQWNIEEKSWRGLTPNKKWSAYFQGKGWQLQCMDKCEFSNFFLFQQAKMIISVLVTWMIVDCHLVVRVLLSF